MHRTCPALQGLVSKTGVQSPQIKSAADRFPRPHIAKRRPPPPPPLLARSSAQVRSRARRFSGRHLVARFVSCSCTTLASGGVVASLLLFFFFFPWSNISVVSSVVGWRLLEIPAGCRPPLVFLPARPGWCWCGGGINLRIIRSQIEKGKEDLTQAGSASQALRPSLILLLQIFRSNKAIFLTRINCDLRAAKKPFPQDWSFGGNLQKPKIRFPPPSEDRHSPAHCARKHCMLVAASLMVMAMEKTDHLARGQRQQGGRPAVTACRQQQQSAAAAGAKRQRQNVPPPPPTKSPAAAGGLSAEAFVVLACVAVSLIVLPLVLPPLPPPPPLLLLVPVCLLLLLAALATFVPSDIRTMASSS